MDNIAIQSIAEEQVTADNTSEPLVLWVLDTGLGCEVVCTSYSKRGARLDGLDTVDAGLRASGEEGGLSCITAGLCVGKIKEGGLSISRRQSRAWRHALTGFFKRASLANGGGDNAGD